MNPEKLLEALLLLDAIVADRRLLADVDAAARERLQRVCGEIARPDLKQRKRLQKELLRRTNDEKRAQDEQLRQLTAIRQLRAKPVYSTPPPTSDQVNPTLETEVRPGPGLHTDRVCYVCKKSYQNLHFFYDQLCQSCGDISYQKRAPSGDLTGRTAVITGARVKIGYHAAILLLRNGCDVVVTTRFPRDGAARFAREPDFDVWKDRLSLYGLDLRHTPSVDALARHLSTTLPRLDFLLHNACQTVRRPPGFYAHLLEQELKPLASLPAAQRRIVEADDAFRAHDPALPLPAQMSQLESEQPALPSSTSSLASIFPAGALDQDLQQIDLRAHNSWRAALGEVPTLELLEVLLVNAAAPFVLTSKLRPLLARDNVGRDRHVVNVSAMEGQFYRANKTSKHPHTNMAKAALNMLTRTSAQDLAQDGVWMNAVDTGWVTDEDPTHLAALKVKEHRFSPPLDVVDGAARIVDPIFAGLHTGKHACGVFFKDYLPARW